MFRGRSWQKAERGARVLVFGVTATGDFRNYNLITSFQLTDAHVDADTPIMIGAQDALGYDYVIVVREQIAKAKGWLS